MQGRAAANVGKGKGDYGVLNKEAKPQNSVG